MSSQEPSRLFITEGIHTGASVELRSGDMWLVGSGPDADIILEDPGIFEAHVKFTVNRRDPGCLDLHAFEGAFRVDDGRTISPGSSTQLSAPARFALLTADGRTVTLFFDVASTRRDRRGRRVDGRARAAWAVGVGSVAALAAVAVFFLMGPMMERPGPEAQSAELTVPVPQPAVPWPTGESAPPQPVEPTRVPAVEAAANALRDRLEAEGLNHLVVTIDGAAIGVSGALLPTQEAPWRNVRRWFDGSQAVPLVADIATGSAEAPMPARPTGVWLGDDPYIVDAGGVRRHVGNLTSDGWRVDAISADGVRLSREGREIAISF